MMVEKDGREFYYNRQTCVAPFDTTTKIPPLVRNCSGKVGPTTVPQILKL